MKDLTQGQELMLRLSMILMCVGFPMVAAMMYFENEPGLLPLAILTIGIGLYLLTKWLLRRRG